MNDNAVSTTLLRVFAACALAAFGHDAGAATTARSQLLGFVKDLKQLRGTFTQEVRDATGKPVESSSGVLALSAPRQFRWQYDKPFPQLIVADGDNVWIYDEDLSQVTVKNQSTEEVRSPLTVLIDPAQLDRDYTVVESGERDGALWMTLTPKSDDAPFVDCQVATQPSGPVQMVLTDHLGQKNTLRFGLWERNPKLGAELFRFVPPKGADVVGEPVRHAEVTPLRD